MQSRNVKELQNCRYSAVTKLQTCRPRSKNLNIKLTLNICQLAQDPESRVHGIQSETALSKIRFHLKSTVLGTKKDNKTISLTKIISFYRCTIVLFMCSGFFWVFLNLLKEKVSIAVWRIFSAKGVPQRWPPSTPPPSAEFFFVHLGGTLAPLWKIRHFDPG